MVITIALVIFFILLFVLRKHTGPAHLAVIAGLSVYEMFGDDLVSIAAKVADNVPTELLGHIVFLILVVGFPMMLYLRSHRGGLFGLLRIAEAVIFAALLVSLCADSLAYFFSFDAFSQTMVDLIGSFKGPIVIFGLITAYFDILFYHD